MWSVPTAPVNVGFRCVSTGHRTTRSFFLYSILFDQPCAFFATSFSSQVILSFCGFSSKLTLGTMEKAAPSSRSEPKS